MNIVCENCKGSFGLDKFTLISKAVEGHEGVEDWGLECPKCKTWVHCYYLNKELKKLQAGIRNRQERRTYTHKFDKFQKVMTRKATA